MTAHRRRNYFIDRRFQTKYILYTIVLLLAYTLTLITMIFVPYVSDLLLGGPLAQQTEAARTLLALHGRIWPGVFAAILLFSFLSVYISHRIAGPVYRIKKGLQALVQGDLRTTVQLRRRDDLKDLAECTNRVRDELRTLLAALGDSQALLLDCQRRQEGGTAVPVTTAEVLKNLQAGIARNQEIIDRYRTS